jgi:hypothetical protein
MLAAVACSEDNIQPDEVVQRVYAAFRQQDDQELEQGFKKQKQAQVTNRRRQVELEQRKLLRQSEDPQIKTLFAAGQKFAIPAKQATNSMGRDKQYFSGAKVPLLKLSTSEGVLRDGVSHLICQDWYFLSNRFVLLQCRGIYDICLFEIQAPRGGHCDQ